MEDDTEFVICNQSFIELVVKDGLDLSFMMKDLFRNDFILFTTRCVKERLKKLFKSYTCEWALTFKEMDSQCGHYRRTILPRACIEDLLKSPSYYWYHLASVDDSFIKRIQKSTPAPAITIKDGGLVLLPRTKPIEDNLQQKLDEEEKMIQAEFSMKDRIKGMKRRMEDDSSVSVVCDPNFMRFVVERKIDPLPQLKGIFGKDAAIILVTTSCVQKHMMELFKSFPCSWSLKFKQMTSIYAHSRPRDAMDPFTCIQESLKRPSYSSYYLACDDEFFIHRIQTSTSVSVITTANEGRLVSVPRTKSQNKLLQKLNEEKKRKQIIHCMMQV